MLVERFSELMDYNFTANMENNLDKIEEGGFKWVDIVMDFYKPFNEHLEDAMKNLGKVKPKDIPTDKKCPEGHPMVIKWGRFGRFYACEKYPEHKHTEPLEDEGSGTDGKGTAAEDQQTDEICVKCSSPMVLKTGRFGRFLACSKYPDCKTTKAMSIGIKCPEDGGDVVEKRTKKGKLFYSCGNYPKCKFATWYKPVEKSCPQCKAGIMVDKRTKKGNFIACINKECKYQEEVEEAENPQELTQD
jgi:DNA topoisomerase-1